MSSNLKVNNILPSTGANIGLGTASGTLNVDGGCKVQVGTALTLGHTQGVQFHTQNLHSQGFEINQINASGIITASHFYGNGANLTNLDASDLASGTVPTARLGSGTASSSTFLRGDSTFATVTSVGGATGVDFNNNVKVRLGTGNDAELYFDGTDMNIKATTNVQNVNIWTEGVKKYQFTDGMLRPLSNNSYDLGQSSLRWRNIYTNDLNLSNEGSTNSVDNTWGDYTIQEGESDLFLINNRSGKKYKFNLTEVS